MCPLPPQPETMTMVVQQQEDDLEGRDSRTCCSKQQQIPEEPKEVSSVSSQTCSSGSIGSDFSQFDDRLVEFLGKALEQVAAEGDRGCLDLVNEHDVFVGTQRVPHITLTSYLRRMVRYTSGPDVSSSWKCLSLGARSLICSLIYLDRLVAKTHLQVNSYRIHRLIVTGMLVSLKMNEDDTLDMGYFAMLAGIPLAQLNKLESVFLDKIGFDTFISPDEFAERVKRFRLKAKTRRSSS